MIEKTICELFAGVGGFRVGLERQNPEWTTVWANQWEPEKKSQYAFDCYTAHFGQNENYVNEDIASINKEMIPQHNLLVGGFPCQDYSVARTGAEGINGKKGILWWQIRETLEAKQPKFVLLENVDRLLKSPAQQKGRDFGIILACLNDLGYSVEWRVINAAEYGFAQKRRRTFIFAAKTITTYENQIQNETFRNIIHETGFFAKEFPIKEHTQGTEYEFSYEDIYEISDKFQMIFENAGVMRQDKIYTEKVESREIEPKKLGEVLEKEADKKYYIVSNMDKWEYLKGPKKINRTSKTGFQYMFSEGGMSFPDALDRPARTMLTSESTLNRSTHIIQDPKEKALRVLTPVEAERINGFDDNWTNTGMPERARYFCMGNALVVGLIEKMGNRLDEIFTNEEENN